MTRRALAGLLAFAALACRKPAETPSPGAVTTPSYTPPDREPPVALNADSPIQYPPALFDQKVEGNVVLRLFVDSSGQMRPESTKVAESSGYPALDSAAIEGAAKLRFAPARRRGLPTSTAFLQPIEFRHPAGQVPKGGPDATTP
jgi:TonB family protein